MGAAGQDLKALAQRARIELDCAAGKDNKDVAAELRVGEHMVARWRGRYTRKRLAGLVRRAAPWQAAVELLDQVEEIVTAI